MTANMAMDQRMSSPDVGDEKIVQTALSQEEYRRFARVAEEEGLTIKEAAARALLSFVAERERPDPDDPLVTFHERHEHPDGPPTSADDVDELLYGGHES